MLNFELLALLKNIGTGRMLIKRKWALSIEIAYFLLKEWHGKVDKGDPEATTPDYISLVNDLIPGHCMQIRQDSGLRISGNLARKAGAVKNLCRNAKNSRECSQLDKKRSNLAFLSMNLSQWRVLKKNLFAQEKRKRKVEGLEEKERELVKKMNEALREKDVCLKGKDQEIAKLPEQNQELFHHISALEEGLGEVGCTGKKLGDLSSSKRSRRLKEPFARKISEEKGGDKCEKQRRFLLQMVHRQSSKHG